MRLLADVCNAFIGQMKRDAQFYKESDLKKQAAGKSNAIDMKQEIIANWAKVKNNMKEAKFLSDVFIEKKTTCLNGLLNKKKQ